MLELHRFHALYIPRVCARENVISHTFCLIIEISSVLLMEHIDSLTVYCIQVIHMKQQTLFSPETHEKKINVPALYLNLS